MAYPYILPSRELTYPTWGKGKSSHKRFLIGYVSYQEDKPQKCNRAFEKWNSKFRIFSSKRDTHFSGCQIFTILHMSPKQRLGGESICSSCIQSQAILLFYTLVNYSGNGNPMEVQLRYSYITHCIYIIIYIPIHIYSHL